MVDGGVGIAARLAQFASAVELPSPRATPRAWSQWGIPACCNAGKRDIERNLPMQRDTIFRIASMTKPMTSVLALKLWEEGKLRLDDPIVKRAPELAERRVLKDAKGPLEGTYPAPRDITVEDLLTHRSGLACAFTSMGPIADAHGQTLGDMDLGSDEYLAAAGKLPLSYAPGERWRYGYSTDVLGFVTERI